MASSSNPFDRPLEPRNPFDDSASSTDEAMELLDKSVSRADLVFGVVLNPTNCDVERIRNWVRANSDLHVSLVVHLLLGCRTTEQELKELEDCAKTNSSSFCFRVLVSSADELRWNPFLCLRYRDEDGTWSYSSLCRDGLVGDRPLPIASALANSYIADFRRRWASSAAIDRACLRAVPALFQLGRGMSQQAVWGGYAREVTEAAARQARDTRASCPPPPMDDIARAPRVSSAGSLEERLASLYLMGSLVTVDQQSHVRPFDIAVSRRMLESPSRLKGQDAGSRDVPPVSVFSSKELQELDEYRRRGLADLLARYTFSLGRGLRWMPHAVRSQFEQEWGRRNKEGQSKLRELTERGPCVPSFWYERQEQIEAGLKTACRARFGEGAVVSSKAADIVIEKLRPRILRALSTSIIPRVAFSPIEFTHVESAASSSWYQARLLLQSIAISARTPILGGGGQPSDTPLRDEQAERLAEDMCVAGDPWVDTRTGLNGVELCRSARQRINEIRRSSESERRKCELLLRLLGEKNPIGRPAVGTGMRNPLAQLLEPIDPVTTQ